MKLGPAFADVTLSLVLSISFLIPSRNFKVTMETLEGRYIVNEVTGL